MSKRTKRTHIKRQLAQALNALERIDYHLGSIYLEFTGHKSGLDEYILEMIKAAAQLQEHILKFWELAWGKRPKDFNNWR